MHLNYLIIIYINIINDLVYGSKIFRLRRLENTRK